MARRNTRKRSRPCSGRSPRSVPSLTNLPVLEYLFAKKFLSDVDELKLSRGSINDLPYESILDSDPHFYGYPTSPRRDMSLALVERCRQWYAEEYGALEDSGNPDLMQPLHEALMASLLQEAVHFTGAPTQGISILFMTQLLDEVVTGSL